MVLREQLILVCFLSACFLFISVALVLVGLPCNVVNVLFFSLGLASLIFIIIIIIMTVSKAHRGLKNIWCDKTLIVLGEIDVKLLIEMKINY